MMPPKQATSSADLDIEMALPVEIVKEKPLLFDKET